MKRVELSGTELQVVNSNYEVVLSLLEQKLSNYSNKFVVFFEGNLLSLCSGDPNVLACLKQADFIFPDGTAVAKLASWQGGVPVERVSGPTFLLKACEYGQSLGWKHFFYGGTPESLEALTLKLKSDYPDLKIVGSYSPPFRALTDLEELDLKRMVDESKPDFLWVGLGGPKQEFWIQAHRESLNVPIMLGIGAAFDFHSGSRPWAPKIIRKLGLEWLWRMVSGGKRTFIRNLKCVSKVSIILLANFFKYKIFFAKKQPLHTDFPDEICKGCDGMPCCSSTPYCPRRTKKGHL
ncbi:MAG: WecB/TagA/CpsF family glycosyltransferase [Lentisphaeria bacterium]|nr:WecB/TagA/CpsF family glycosyltransferase [Lentisphaeria bacterium]